jgi:hypothetical protein
MKTRFVLAAGVVAAVAAAGPAQALIASPSLTTSASNNDNKKPAGTLTADCIVMGQDEGDITYVGPLQLWPPNHKYRTGTFTVYDVDNPEEEVTDETAISVTGTHDEILADGSEMNGAGNTDPASDVVPGAPGAGTDQSSTTARFRGERSGRGDGRTYTFTVMATVDNMKMCDPVTFEVSVPHDQGQGGGSKSTAAKKRAARRR